MKKRAFVQSSLKIKCKRRGEEVENGVDFKRSSFQESDSRHSLAHGIFAGLR